MESKREKKLVKMYLSKNTLSEIFKFVPTNELILSISKISKETRRILQTKDQIVIESRRPLLVKAKTLIELFRDKALDQVSF